MTTKTIKLIVFITLLVHGIGHFQGVVAGLGVKINNAEATRSWLLQSLSDKTQRWICLAMFLVTGIMGILTALSFRNILVSSSSWQIFALITAILSTLCLVFYFNGFAMFFNKIGAIAVNLLIYYSILFNGQWPAAAFED